MWTYKKSYDLLSEAYIKGEVNPWNPCFCMVGNLLGGGDWISCKSTPINGKGRLMIPKEVDIEVRGYVTRGIEFIERASEGTYTPQEIMDIEAMFMLTYSINGGGMSAFNKLSSKPPTQKDEEALWLAFVAGLEKIKEIHVSKGEDVDQEIALPKRYEKAVI